MVRQKNLRPPRNKWRIVKIIAPRHKTLQKRQQGPTPVFLDPWRLQENGFKAAVLGTLCRGGASFFVTYIFPIYLAAFGFPMKHRVVVGGSGGEKMKAKRNYGGFRSFFAIARNLPEKQSAASFCPVPPKAAHNFFCTPRVGAPPPLGSENH